MYIYIYILKQKSHCLQNEVPVCSELIRSIPGSRMVQTVECGATMAKKKPTLPPDKLTLLWKITIFNGKTDYFYGHFQ